MFMSTSTTSNIDQEFTWTKGEMSEESTWSFRLIPTETEILVSDSSYSRMRTGIMSASCNVIPMLNTQTGDAPKSSASCRNHSNRITRMIQQKWERERGGRGEREEALGGTQKNQVHHQSSIAKHHWNDPVSLPMFLWFLSIGMHSLVGLLRQKNHLPRNMPNDWIPSFLFKPWVEY